MYILGYSGLHDSLPGLADSNRIIQGYDSAAAIIKNNQVIACAAEERFTGQKHASQFPTNAIRYCLKEAEIGLEAVSYVAHGFNYDPHKNFYKTINPDFFEKVLSSKSQIQLWEKHFSKQFKSEKFVSVSHHLAHAASAYFPSGFQESLILVADGMGEAESLSVYSAKGKQLELLDKQPIENSLGILYSVITKHLGFKMYEDEYKVMGLAPYGDPVKYRGFFKEHVQLLNNGKYLITCSKYNKSREERMTHAGLLRHLDQNLLSLRLPQTELLQAHKDLAASLQECLEEVLFHALRHWREKTNLDNLCYAGGVALNCTFNGKLIKSGLFSNVFIQPAAGDDGTALGAALYVNSQKTDNPWFPCEMPYYGPSFSKDNILSSLKEKADRIQYSDLSSYGQAAKSIARDLQNDLVVALFQGRMEYGPRALGNRSILANPTKSDIQLRLNRIIKKRENFRPFAPAVLAEKFHELFEFQESTAFDYMLAISYVKPEWKGKLPGVTHVDGSARVETVYQDSNPFFYQIIKEFGDLSGVCSVINTSFNIKDQPIVLSPEMALDTFLNTQIDVLYLETYKVIKAQPA